MKQKTRAVPYYRVSTERQGQSGLGLEAQQKSVRDYAQAHDLELLGEHIEVESGRNNKRPVLLQALAHCQKEGAILLIAKLDRLARNVAFIAKLMESDADFVAVDNPDANKLIVHIMAAFAEYERDQISSRTKEALAAAKRRGVKLGTNGNQMLADRNRQAAIDFARAMQPVIYGLQREGHTTVRAIARMLNRRSIAPFTGSEARWHRTSVHELLKRIKHL